MPETIAAANFINGWIDAQADLPEGTPYDRGLGLASFEVEGEFINGLAQPYRFYLLSRLQEDFDALETAERAQVEALLEESNLMPVIEARLKCRIIRKDNSGVWGERITPRPALEPTTH